MIKSEKSCSVGVWFSKMESYLTTPCPAGGVVKFRMAILG